MGKIEKGLKNVIIIPTLNNLDYLKGCLKSIQMSEPYGIVVIDNCSNDGTEEFMKKSSKSKNVVYYRGTINLGAAASWNLGVSLGAQLFNATKFYILNNDILLHPRTLDLLSKALDRKEVLMATARNVSGACTVPTDVFEYPARDRGIERDTPDYSCFSIKRETIEKIGLFDEAFYPAYFEDNDYHYRMKLEGYVAHCLYYCPYFHFGSRTMAVSKKYAAYSRMRYGKNREYFVRKWGGKPGQEKYKEAFDGKPPKEIKIPAEPPRL